MVRILKAIIAALLLAPIAAADVHLQWAEDDGLATLSMVANGDPVHDVIGVQAYLEWEPAAQLYYETLLPATLEGFPLGAIGINDSLDDGDALYVWLCSLDSGPVSVGSEPIDIVELWFDAPVTLDLVSEALPGLGTQVAIVGGAFVWDGECSSVQIPEPVSLVLLALGGLAMTGKHSRS